MRATILVLVASLLFTLQASAQEGPHYSEGMVPGPINWDELLVAAPVVQNQASPSPERSMFTAQCRTCLRCVSRGIGCRICNAGITSWSATLADEDAQSRSYNTDASAANSRFVAAWSFGADSSVHGWMTAECPNGSSDDSYGPLSFGIKCDAN